MLHSPLWSMKISGIRGWHEHLHNMISTAGSLGFSDLKDRCRELEAAIRGNSRVDVQQDLFLKLQNLITIAFRWIDGKESNSQADIQGQKEIESIETLKEKLQTIQSQAETRDAGIIGYFDTPIKDEEGILHQNFIAELEDMIVNFEFKKIERAINEIWRDLF